MTWQLGTYAVIIILVALHRARSARVLALKALGSSFEGAGSNPAGATDYINRRHRGRAVQCGRLKGFFCVCQLMFPNWPACVRKIAAGVDGDTICAANTSPELPAPFSWRPAQPTKCRSLQARWLSNPACNTVLILSTQTCNVVSLQKRRHAVAVRTACVQ